MIRCIAVDDEKWALDLLADNIRQIPYLDLVARCKNTREVSEVIHKEKIDIIFLDVQMPKVTGFEMLELLEEPPAVIFTTAFDDYAIKAFDAHAVDYLLKPFSPERFNQAVEKFLQQNAIPESKKTTKELLETVSKTEEKLDRIVVKTGTKIRIIPEQDILFLEAEGDYINIHTPEGRFLKTKTMQYFEDALDPKKFVRIHRSYIIQLAQITKIEPYEKDTHTVVLKNGARLPVSRNGYGKLKQALDI